MIGVYTLYSWPQEQVHDTSYIHNIWLRYPGFDFTPQTVNYYHNFNHSQNPNILICSLTP